MKADKVIRGMVIIEDFESSIYYNQMALKGWWKKKIIILLKTEVGPMGKPGVSLALKRERGRGREGGENKPV